MNKKFFGRGAREKGNETTLFSPADGKVLPLEQVEDEVFSTGILGEGIALIPETGEIFAPSDGVIATVFETRHAISMTADFGAELLIHCGIDTVELKGEGFSVFVQEKERVTRGQLLLRFDPDFLRKKGYAVTTPIVVANGERFSVSPIAKTHVRHGDALLALSENTR